MTKEEFISIHIYCEQIIRAYKRAQIVRFDYFSPASLKFIVSFLEHEFVWVHEEALIRLFSNNSDLSYHNYVQLLYAYYEEHLKDESF